jgi:hypothetical protein
MLAAAAWSPAVLPAVLARWLVTAQVLAAL